MRAERIPLDVTVGTFHKAFNPVSVDSWRDNNQLLKDAPGYHETLELSECKYCSRRCDYADEYSHSRMCCSFTGYFTCMHASRQHIGCSEVTQGYSTNIHVLTNRCILWWKRLQCAYLECKWFYSQCCSHTQTRRRK
jgi:hypothetical protein